MSKRKDLLSWAWILLCGVLTLATYLINRAAPHGPGAAVGYFDADVASEMIIASSLIKNHAFLVIPGFSYSTEVAAVADHLTLAVGLLLFPHNWTLARGISLIINMALVVAAYRFMAKELDTWDGYKWVAGIFLLPLSPIYRDFFLLGQFYMMTVSLCFAITGLCVKASKSERLNRPLLALGALLGFAFGMNGFRTPLLYYFPMVVASLTVALYESNGNTLKQRLLGASRPNRHAFAEALSVLLGGIAGVLTNILFLRSICKFSLHGHAKLTGFQASKFLDDFFAGLVESWGFCGSDKALSEDGIANLGGLLFVLIMTVCIVACIANWRRLKGSSRLMLCYVTIGYVFSAIIYWLYGTSSARYLTFFAVPAIGLIPMSLKLVRHDRLLSNIVTGFTIAAVLAQATGYWYAPSVRHMLSGEAYPKERLVQWLEDEGHDAGYATFWNCNDLVEISNGELDIWSLPGNADPVKVWWHLENYQWLADKSHTEADPEGEIFLVLDATEKQQLSDAGINPGISVHDVDEYSVYLYDSADAMRATFGVSPA